MLADAGMPAVDEARVTETVGEGSATLVDLLMGPGKSVRWLPVYLDHYRRLNGTSATLYPNVREGLDALKAMGLSLAVVTNKPRELVGPLLDHLGVGGSFDAIVGGGDTIDRKPKPAPLVAACERMGVDVVDSVMIGDSINDAVASRAAGALSLTVPYGYPGREGDAGRAEALLQRGFTDAVVADLVAAARWIAAR
jgi:phosphoglycolate phosphatase